jgi:hypothetical protein
MERIQQNDERIIHVNFDTQYDLCSTFVRLQEFYESPFENIHGQFFTMDDFMDTYARSTKNGAFSYFEDWGGFNVPGDTVILFKETFYSDLRWKEMELLSQARNYLTVSDPKFYVIGTYGPSGENRAAYIEHELAHAYFYLNPEYKSLCDNIFETIVPDIKKKVEAKLLDMGYHPYVVPDEFQAYFATDTESSLRKRFGLSDNDLVIKYIYREAFEKFNKKAP